jgi:hypothetical protein
MAHMDIGEWLGELLNRVATELIAGALVGTVVAVSSESGSAGVLVGALTVVGFVVLEVLNWADFLKASG